MRTSCAIWAARLNLTRIRRKFSSNKHGLALDLRVTGFGFSTWDFSHGARRDRLDLHDLGFFVLEMIVDGFDEAIGELLHFILNIAEAVLG